MAMATGTVWRDRAGRKKREIEEKLRGGTNPSKIESDWQELETLYDRAGLLDLYDRDMIIEVRETNKMFGIFAKEDIKINYIIHTFNGRYTKNIPILFVVEDNNLSILTEKKVRRNWEMDSVAKGFGVEAYNISDDPEDIRKHLDGVFEKPMLLNINTIRKYWHAGAGIDDENVFDRYESQMKMLGKRANIIDEVNKTLIEKLWQRQLEIQ